MLCLIAFPLLNYAQPCAPTTSFTLGNGNDGEGIAFSPTDGLLYHTSGISPGSEYFEPVNPSTGAVGTNLAPSNTWPAPITNEITGMVWYPPLNAFVCMNRSNQIFSVTTTGTFTLLSTYAGGTDIRGFAVVGTSIYGISQNSTQLIEFNPNTGAVISTVTPNIGATNYSGNGLATNPVTGDVWILYRVSGQDRDLGTINLTTGAITPVGDPGINGLAGITFDDTGKLYAITGDGGTPSSTLFTDFPCAPSIAAPVPTLSEWGLILLALVVLAAGTVAIFRKRNAVQPA